MAERSPNFPSMSLGEAIDDIRTIYQREGRSAMPRLSAVKALGYSSINGRSLTKLGALRAYGLLEGRGDDVKVTTDAITILNAPHDAPEWRAALMTAFKSPPAFQLLLDKEDASPDTLRWHLVKANFRDDAAERLVKVFLDSRDLVNAELGGYDSAHSASEPEAVEAAPESPPGTVNRAPHAPKSQGAVPAAGIGSGEAGLAMGIHERVLQAGMLSKLASYRVIVSGPVGVAEIDRLLKKLEVDKEILADPDPEPDEHGETDQLLG